MPNKLKFLVVDDVQVMTSLITQFLHDLGHNNVIRAEDGAQALEMLNAAYETDPVSFVIADINMPNMNGIDFLQKCRKSPRYLDLPFILITSESDKTLVLSAIINGVDDYLLKPFSKEDFRDKINTVIDKKVPHLSKTV